MDNPTFSIRTLGCKVNQVESDDIAAQMLAAGFEQVSHASGADVSIVNTCCVTAVAEAKVRKALRKELKRGAKLVIATGCTAVLSAEELAAIDGRIVVEPDKTQVGATAERNRGALTRGALVGGRQDAPLSDRPTLASATEVLVDTNASNVSAITQGTIRRARPQIKVSDGCENFCSFCVVPYARGPVKPVPSAEIIARVQAAVDSGAKEVVLTGINIGTYHCDGLNLGQLIAKLRSDTGIHRVRVSSVEPQTFHREFVDLLRETDILCEQLHIPLQSGSDAVLVHMNRKYNTAQYRAGIGVLRGIKPNIALHTDIIVGYPTETEADFKATLELARELQFAGAHLFKYSARLGTPAAELAPLDPHIIDERYQRLKEVTDESAAAYRKMRLAAQNVAPLELIVEKVEQHSFTATSREHLTIKHDFETLQFEQLVHFVLAQELSNTSRAASLENVELSISFVTSQESARLNEQYRSKTGPTDVLSFAFEDEINDESTLSYGDSDLDECHRVPDGGAAVPPVMLGDVIIAPEVAADNAIELGTALEAELHLLLVHGLLHLLGYDHIEDADADKMQARELELLNQWRSERE